jgi:glycosyltransferase involved in cell wall biosynthesis
VRIAQAVFGVFHHFELAREMERRGHLEVVYSTWPWARLKREGLAHEKVQTYPWIHVSEYVAGRSPIAMPWLTDELGYLNALAFDQWTLRRLQKRTRQIGRVDALIGLAGSCLSTGRWLQGEGGKFVCDRGSTHQRYQEQIVSEEYRRWGVEIPVSDIRDTVREEEIYEMADAITVPSQFAGRTYVEMGIPAEKIKVIPYGVRLEAFRPTEPAAEGAFDVLFAGAVGLRKGVPCLLEAFAALKHPRKRLRVVGYPQQDMRDVWARLPKEHVEVLGPVPQTELARLMSSSHVMVLPSIEEGLALVQAQAMACGCPVIASTNTGSEDLYTDGVEGFIVAVNDVKAVMDRMQQLADDSALRGRMREAGLRRVQTIGGWTQYGAGWESMLRELTGVS